MSERGLNGTRRSTALTLAISLLVATAGCRPSPPPPSRDATSMATASKEAPGGPPPPACTPPASAKLSMKLIAQETTLWCWAASAQMVMDSFGTQVKQCEQANKRLGLTTCCNASTPRACIQTGWPEFAKFGFAATQQTTRAALTWGQLTTEIGCGKRPVAFSWKWTGGNGHMMVAHGYEVTSQGVREVVVHDPAPVGKGEPLNITYDAYVSAQNYTHWNDFYNIAP